MSLALIVGLLQVAALENAYVRVTRDAAPCAAASVPNCSDRVIVALGAVQLRSGGSSRKLARGEIAVFKAGESYETPSGGPYYEVAVKSDHPPIVSPAESIAPEKNNVLFDGERLFIFEERLPVGATRARHSHSQRVVIQLNRTRLQQWPDGQPDVMRDIVPDSVAFNQSVIHKVKNVGALPLRGIVIELKAEKLR